MSKACKACGNHPEDIVPDGVEEYEWEYCPACGASMDEDDDGEAS